MSTDVPKIFRITVEVADLDKAAAFYAKLLGTDGKRRTRSTARTPGP